MTFPDPRASDASAAAEVMPLVAQTEPHIIDTLIDERSRNLARSPFWPLIRPLIMRALHYKRAVSIANFIRDMPGFQALEHVGSLLGLDLQVEGLENLPRTGTVILAPSHPTGIPDGIAIFEALKGVRPDIAIFANRDATRICPGFRDVMIPVEWRAGEKSHAKGRDTLEMTARAFAAQRTIVLFPSGRIAYWHKGALTERPWQPSVVALARRYGCPVVPVNIQARNSGLFYFVSRLSTDLRDITIFHELLNKTGSTYRIRIGRPIASDQLDGDPTAVTARLQEHAVHALAADIDARFEPAPVAPSTAASLS